MEEDCDVSEEILVVDKINGIVEALVVVVVNADDDVGIVTVVDGLVANVLMTLSLLAVDAFEDISVEQIGKDIFKSLWTLIVIEIFSGIAYWKNWHEIVFV